MTKIAFFLPSLDGGGAERVCVNLAAGFLSRGLEVDIVLSQARGPLLHTIPAGVRVIDLAVRRALAATFPLVAYLRHEKPFALIAAPDHANLIAVWARMLAGVKTRTVITNHNYLSIVIRQSPKMQEKLYPYLLRLFQRYATYIVAVSEGAAVDLARTAHIPLGRVSVIHNPAVHPALYELAARLPAHPWFAGGHPPVILAVGRLTPQKDYPTLLRAFSLLRAKGLIHLVILGEGKQRAELEMLAVHLGISSDVDLPGFDINPYRYMARCNVFVLSSAWEGFSIVLAEALACGAQIIATDCFSGPAEILARGKYGRLVPVGDADAMAVEIENALLHPLPKDLLYERAGDFTIDVAVEKYLRLLMPDR